MFDARLINNLRRFSNRTEATAYLDLVGDLLGALGITDDDPRFHFNPAAQTRFVLPLTINNRYIVCKGRDVDGEATWILIHPGPHAMQDFEAGQWLEHWSFAHKRYDPPDSAPRLVRYRATFLHGHLPLLFPQVLDIARRELDACRGTTPCRTAHHSRAYALALDDGRRQELLGDVAFGAGSRFRRTGGVNAG